ncbi:ABC transporter G family member 20 [Salvelinus sp. IW2-2015]|uniref:ABC transporter G family member 20 n=1 Tax=Salvelinus sp. IW2-2015 TaxID=2691554 RepID=UPI0038D41022
MGEPGVGYSSDRAAGCDCSPCLVISSAIDDEQNANQAALGIFYPNLIVSGIIWPVECIPYPLRYISLALPQTYASEALRCIMYRGWGLSRMRCGEASLSPWAGTLSSSSWPPSSSS